MTENQECRLEILLDDSGTTTEQLKQDCEKLLHDYLVDVDMQLIPLQSGQLLLTLKGSLEHIDACHDEINKNLVGKSKRRCVRLVDEAGDHIRIQAYPILAQIEQRFRSFINRATIEVFGFDWWNRYAPAPLQEKILQTSNRDKEYGTVLHPLEYTQFDDLVELVTAEASEWSDSKPLSASDLLTLLAGCNSIEDAIAKLQVKMKKVSLWDSVFARYFQERGQWDQVKASLSFTITQRHKVMHHRPIRRGTLDALRQHANQLEQLLDSAKTKLSEQDRKDAQSEISEKLTISPYILKMDTEIMRKLAESMSVMSSPATESMRKLAESMSVMSSPATESIRKLAESVSAMSSPAMESIRKLAESESIMNSLATESMRKLAESIAPMDFAATESIRKLAESMSAMSSPAMESIRRLAESESIMNSLATESMRKLAESISMTNSPAIRQMKELESLTEQTVQNKVTRRPSLESEPSSTLRRTRKQDSKKRSKTKN